MRRAAFLTAALAAFIAASPAAAAWTQQRLTPTASGLGDDASLAGNDRGDAAVAFTGDRGIALAVAEPGRAFGPGRYVPGGRAGRYAHVTIDRRGNVLVAWAHFDGSRPPDPNHPRDEGCCWRPRLALLPAGSRRLVGPRDVGTRGEDVYGAALSIVEGRVGVAWSDSRGVAARFAPRALKLGPVVRAEGMLLAAVPLRSGPMVTFVRDDSIYSSTGTTLRWSLWELRLRPGRARTLRRLTSRSGWVPVLSDLATNDRGEQAIAWEEAQTPDTGDVYLGTRSSSGRFSVHLTSRRGPDGALGVAIAQSGAAVAAWDDGGRRILVADRRPGGAFGRVRPFGSQLHNRFITDLAVAVDPAGRALIASRQLGPDVGPDVFAAFRTLAGAQIGASKLGYGGSLSRDKVALDRHGLGRVVLGGGGSVIAARRRMPGSQPPDG